MALGYGAAGMYIWGCMAVWTFVATLCLKGRMRLTGRMGLTEGETMGGKDSNAKR